MKILIPVIHFNMLSLHHHNLKLMLEWVRGVNRELLWLLSHFLLLSGILFLLKLSEFNNFSDYLRYRNIYNSAGKTLHELSLELPDVPRSSSGWYPQS